MARVYTASLAPNGTDELRRLQRRQRVRHLTLCVGEAAGGDTGNIDAWSISITH